MSSRRAALVSRYRATGTDRVRQLILRMMAWAATPPETSDLDAVRRDLHTFKGDSRMVGFAAIADLVHAIEDRFAAEPVRAIEALRVIGDALSGALGTDEEAAVALEATKARMLLDPRAVTPGPAPSRTTTATKAAPRDDRWVQISMERVEGLCTSVGKLASDLRTLATQLRGDRATRDLVESCLARVAEVEETSWLIRIVPVAPMFEALTLHAMELATALDKTIQVVTTGSDIALERNVLDAIHEPLLHLIRNALDHGIEPRAERGTKPRVATLTLHAEQQGAHVNVEVADDGRGIDTAEVRRVAIARGLLDDAATKSDAEIHALLFRPGFSTREHVTDVSGRGVGLEVVSAVLDRLGGDIRIESSRGEGSRFSLRIPVRFGKEHVLVVDAGIFVAIAARDIARVVTRAEAGDPTQVTSLAELLGHAREFEPWAILVDSATSRVLLGVSRLVSEAELVIHPADPIVGAGGLFRGTSVFQGRPVVVVNARSLVARAASAGAVVEQHAAAGPASHRALDVLLVDDSAIILTLVTEIVERAGMTVRTAMDGAQGLAAITERAPDLVVSDLEMPNMDGFELLQQVRARLPALPFILLTTRSGEHDRARAAELGATAYLTKTEFGEASLLEAIRTSTETRRW